MVTKNKGTGEKQGQKGRVRVGKLKLNRETVQDLTSKEKNQVVGGLRPRGETQGCSDCKTWCGCTTPERRC